MQTVGGVPSRWVSWLLAGPVFGFFLREALINFRADRPVLGVLHTIALCAWLGLLLILESRVI
jgi:hypothetical protein